MSKPEPIKYPEMKRRRGLDNQELVFQCIFTHWTQFQVPPSMSIICHITGIGSKSTVHTICHRLVDDGRLRHTPDYKPKYFVPVIK